MHLFGVLICSVFNFERLACSYEVDKCRASPDLVITPWRSAPGSSPVGLPSGKTRYMQLRHLGYEFGIPSVSGIATDSEHFVKVVDSRDAQPKDLVVHLKEDGAKYNHVGVFSSTDIDGKILEISAQSRADAAKKDRQDPKFKSSVKEAPAVLIQENEIWRIYRWKS